VLFSPDNYRLLVSFVLPLLPLIASGEPLCAQGIEAQLTPDELIIARRIGFDPNVVSIIKRRLNPSMSVGESGVSVKSSLNYDMIADLTMVELLPQDRMTLNQTAKDFPLLAERIARQLKFCESREKPQSVSSPESDGKITRGVLVLGFSGDGGLEYAQDSRILAIEPELNQEGYYITQIGAASHRTREFERREDAEEYLRSSGTLCDDTHLRVQQPASYVAKEARPAVQFVKGAMHPPRKISGEHFLFPIPYGAKVKFLSPGLWHVDCPARYIARAVERTAVVERLPKDSIGLELIYSQGTGNALGRISQKQTVEKIKFFNKKYGARVISARLESFRLRFQVLPGDLSELCHEIRTFTGPTYLSSDETEQARRTRQEAQNIRSTKTVEIFLNPIVSIPAKAP